MRVSGSLAIWILIIQRTAVAGPLSGAITMMAYATVRRNWRPILISLQRGEKLLQPSLPLAVWTPRYARRAQRASVRRDASSPRSTGNESAPPATACRRSASIPKQKRPAVHPGGAFFRRRVETVGLGIIYMNDID